MVEKFIAIIIENLKKQSFAILLLIAAVYILYSEHVKLHDESVIARNNLQAQIDSLNNQVARCNAKMIESYQTIIKQNTEILTQVKEILERQEEPRHKTKYHDHN